MPELEGNPSNSPTSIEEFTSTTFDFIICGGGTAGLTIAARLTENPDVTVGVVEAGKYKPNDSLIDTPLAFPQMFENPEYDWCLYTAPQIANKNRIHHIPRGKTVGGSSAINYMMYVRGSLQDYDDWAALAGDEGWNAENMAAYMRKHQTLEQVNPAAVNSSSPLEAAFHGTSGPIHTSFNDAVLPIETDFIKAAAEVTDFPNLPVDAWSGNHLGFYNTLGTVTRTGPNAGKRSHAGRECYEANKSRPNLKLLTEARVNKVILDGNRAIGASITVNGAEYTAAAKHEIIVSGGTIQSPQILELSGIGDPEVLAAAGVECKVRNPGVGANVQDHSLSIVSWDTQPGVFTSDSLTQIPEAMQEAMKQYAETGSGPLSSIGSTQGFFPAKRVLSHFELAEIIQDIRAIEPTSPFHEQQLEQVIAQLESDISGNMQLVFLPSSMNLPAGIEHQGQLYLPRPPDTPPRVSVACCIEYPVSRGYIHIHSSDPAIPPVIQPNYITQEADVILLAAFLRWADKVAQIAPFSSSISNRVFPSPSVDLQDLEQGKEYVRDIAIGEYHICGSVAMGDALDSKLRVKGTTGLRVADASVFPNNISGNLVGSVYAVAERAADLIREEYGL